MYTRLATLVRQVELTAFIMSVSALRRSSVRTLLCGAWTPCEYSAYLTKLADI